jgi:hypothetical protein
MKNADSNNEDRRLDARFELPEPLSAHMNLEGYTISGELIDLSNSGAKLRLAESRERPPLEKGSNTDWIVRLPSGGQAKLKGSVCWFQRFPEGFILGLRFGDLPDGSLFSELRSFRRIPA